MIENCNCNSSGTMTCYWCPYFSRPPRCRYCGRPLWVYPYTPQEWEPLWKSCPHSPNPYPCSPDSTGAFPWNNDWNITIT